MTSISARSARSTASGDGVSELRLGALEAGVRAVTGEAEAGLESIPFGLSRRMTCSMRSRAEASSASSAWQAS